MKKINLFFLIYVFLSWGIHTTQAQSVSASLINNVTCYGLSNGSVTCTPSGGITPYTYSWLPGGQTNQTAIGLAAATYTITLTDHLAHTASATTTVSQPAALSVTAWAKQSAVCPGSSDSLYCSGVGGTIPYNYLWTAPYDDISCPSCGYTNYYPYGAPYIITDISDYNGCTATASISVTVYPFPYVTISGPINPIAPGRADTLIAHAIGATSYAWSNSSTTSAIIVSPSVSTTYSVTVHNTYGCLDTAHYTIDTNSVGNGATSSNAIRIVPSATLNMASISTKDSVVWFSFAPTDSNNQIIANSAFLGMPVPHVHRLTLYNSSMQMVVDEHMPDITGANQIRIDISHLDIGNTYYVRAARCPAQANMAGCNPSSAGECNPTQRWDFQIGFRTVPVFVPDDSGSEPFSINQLYYECRGQKEDFNAIPRFDIKAYTDNATPAVYASDSAVSFVYEHIDTGASFIDTAQRVDMVLTGSSVQPSQPVYKMGEDSGVGNLNYYLGYVPNGVTKVEGYSRLVYKNVYSNVDMQVYSNLDGTKFYFVCNPPSSGGSAGNPSNIEIQFKGANSVSVTGSGGLNVATDLGTLSFAPGYAYTDSAGVIKPKSWQPYFITVNSNTVRFNTGTYNTAEPLIIRVDRGHRPLPPNSNNLMWSTYAGGSNDDYYCAVTNDGWGSNEIATGYTLSNNFPVTGGSIKGTLVSATNNAIITSFTSSNVRNWSTYFGGSATKDRDFGYAITADRQSNVYITGTTVSPDFPIHTPAGAFTNPSGFNAGNPTQGIYDAFIVELNKSGQLVWSSYFGGTGSEVGQGIAADASANVYMVGGQEGEVTASTIPTYTVAGAYNSNQGTAWIAKFNSSHAIVWATDIGSNNGIITVDDKLYGCDIDGNNDLYVTGDVQESGFPINGPSPIVGFVTNASANAVIAKINGSTLAIDWATYYGGDGYDRGVSITANTTDYNTYITGNTTSPMYSVSIPISNSCCGYPALQTSIGGAGVINTLIAGFSMSSGTFMYGSYFGGNSTIEGAGITWFNGIYITGQSYGNGLPIPRWGNPAGTWNVTSVPATQRTAFVAFFPYSLTNNLDRFSYNWGTYFGGSGTDNGQGIASPNQGLYIVGSTTSTNFPFVNSGSPTPWYQSANAGNYDAFISEFAYGPTTVGAGIDDITSEDNELKAYPNPASQNVTVQMNIANQQDVEFRVYNLLGEPVYSTIVNEPAGSITEPISVSSLPNGNYILEVTANGTVYHTKITKLQ